MQNSQCLLCLVFRLISFVGLLQLEWTSLRREIDYGGVELSGGGGDNAWGTPHGGGGKAWWKDQISFLSYRSGNRYPNSTNRLSEWISWWTSINNFLDMNLSIILIEQQMAAEVWKALIGASERSSPPLASCTSGRSMDWERKNVSRWIFFEIGRW